MPEVSGAVEGRQYFVFPDYGASDPELFLEFLDKIEASGVISLDIESTGKNVFAEDFDLVGFSVSPDGKSSYYFPVSHELWHNPGGFYLHDDARDLLMMLVDMKPRIVYHNASFDMLGLHRTLGIDLQLLLGDDTMLLGFLTNENAAKGLKGLSLDFLGLDESPFSIKDVDVSTRAESLFEEDPTHVPEKKGSRKKAHRLLAGWEDELYEYLFSFHQGSMSFKLVMHIMKSFYTVGKAHKVPGMQFTGPWRGNFRHVPVNMAALYAGDDVINTWLLFEHFTNSTLAVDEALNRLYLDIELPAMHVMTAASAMGVELDKDFLLEMQEKLESRASRIVGEVWDILNKLRLAGVTSVDPDDAVLLLNSPKMLTHLLYTEFGFKVVAVTEKGSPSVSKSTLNLLADLSPKHHKEFEADIKELLSLKRKLSDINKLKGTYVDNYVASAESTGKLHPWYNTVGTVTGRMSSNFQQLPRLTSEELAKKPWLEGIDIRQALTAPEGYVFVSADVVAMEMTVAAWVADEPVLKELLNLGKDLHVHTAKGGFDVGHDLSDEDFKSKFPLQRQDAKILNFALLYAGTAFTLQKSFGFEKSKAVTLERNFRKTYPALASWMEDVYEKLETDGFVVYPKFGFRKKLDAPDESLQRVDPWQYRRRLMGAKRTGLNAVIQGTSAYIIKEALVKISKEMASRNLDAMVIAQVHDELVVLAKREDALEVQEIMVGLMEQDLDGVLLKADSDVKLNLSKSAAKVQLDFDLDIDEDELDQMMRLF